MPLTIRPACQDAVAFRTDVAVRATQDQGRWPDDADEAAFREGYADWTREQVRGEIPHSTTSVLVRDGTRVGRLRVVREPDVIELAGLQLLPAYQRRGLGADVLTGLAHEAAAAGLPLELLVEKDNPGARRFYDRHGFGWAADTATEHRLRLDPPDVG